MGMHINKQTVMQCWKKLIADKKRVEEEMDEFLRVELLRKQSMA